MTIADIKSDVVSHLTDNWNTGVCSMPEILEGDRKTNLRGNQIKYRNSIKVWDNGMEPEYVDPQRKIWDEYYNVKLEIGSRESESNLKNILSETQRIIGLTGISNYDNQLILGVKRKDSSEEYYSEFDFIAIKYNQSV